MGKAGDEWLAQVEPHFGFVRAHGFDTVEIDDSNVSNVGGPIVTYLSSAAAIRIANSYEFWGCEVELIRLIKGAVPPVPIWVTSAPVHRVELANVVAERRPRNWLARRRRWGNSPRAAASQLRHWARILRRVAPEFLDSDLSAIDDGANAIRRRMNRRGQKLTISMPNTASGAEVAKTTEDAKALLEPGVDLQVRTYWHRRRSPSPKRQSRGGSSE